MQFFLNKFHPSWSRNVEQSDVDINECSTCKISIFLIWFQKKNWNLIDRFYKKYSLSSFTKIHPVVAELFHADGLADEQMNMMEQIVIFQKSVDVKWINL